MFSADTGPSESADRTGAQTSTSTPQRTVTPLPTRPGTSAPNDEWDGHVRSTRRDAVTSPEIEARRKSLPPRHTHRGLTFEEIEENGIISIDEKSSQFNQLPISEAEIKKLPKKLRPYYRHLAQLRDHYEEVDGILSGELPSTIASSFNGHQKQSHSREHSRRSGEGATYEDEYDEEGTPKFIRHNSAWRLHSSRKDGGKGDYGSIEHPSNGSDTNGHVENGESEPLLSTPEKEEKRERTAKIALNVNTAVNVVLVAAKAAAVLYSSSISLTASLVDSALDLLSTFIILATTWAIGVKTDPHAYPAGKRRFEPLGVLIFSVAMIASFVQVFIESFQRAIDKENQETVALSALGIGTMLATIGVKLILWQWCSRIPSSGVQALAQDAENDVWFNAMSLAFPFIGGKVHSRLLDPIGGMVLSTYIIVEWVKTLLENFAKLSGKAAPSDQLTRVLYLVTRFNPVLEIGDVEVYHIGDEVVVEVDVILPRTSTLHFAHDVGETIQCVLESLDGVMRAYVHCDYSSQNPAQHTARQPSESIVARRNSDSNMRGRDSKASSASVTPRPRFARLNSSNGPHPVPEEE